MVGGSSIAEWVGVIVGQPLPFTVPTGMAALQQQPRSGSTANFHLDLPSFTRFTWILG